MNTNNIVNSNLFLKAIEDPAFLNAFGSAIGGFVGVLLLFLIRWGIAAYKNRDRLVQLYTVANYANPNPTVNLPVHGAVIPSCGSISILNKKQVWKYCANDEKTRAKDNTSGNLFYGPYSSLPRPGHYKAKFKIYAEGLPDAKDEHDYLLLELDVTQVLKSLMPTPNGLAHVNDVQTIARSFVRISTLRPQTKWVEIDIIFYSDAKGLWEFRAFAYNGKEERPDFVKKCGDALAIYFDSVEIYLLPSFEIPTP